MSRRRRRGRGVLTRRRLLAGAGAALLGGTVASDAFTTASTPRGAAVNVAADADAYLSLSGLDDTSVAPTVGNNAPVELSVTLSSGDGTDLRFAGGTCGTTVTATIPSSDSRSFESCGSGDVPFTLTAVPTTAGSDVDRVELARTLGGQASQVRSVAGSVSSSGASGKFGFEIENTGTVDVTIVAVGVDETTNPDAVEVSSGDVLTAGGDPVAASPITVGDPTLTDLDPDVTVPAGTTTSFEFDKFRTGGGGGPGGGGGGPGGGPGGGGGSPNADMRGEDVRTTLAFEDGSSTVVDLCQGGCDF